MSWAATEVELVKAFVNKGKDKHPTTGDLERIRLQLKEEFKTKRSTSAIRHQINKLKRPRVEKEQPEEPQEDLENARKDFEKKLLESELLLWNTEFSECASLDDFIAQQFKDLETFAQVDTAYLRNQHKEISLDDVRRSRPQIVPRQQLVRELQLLFVQMVQLERKTKQAEIEKLEGKLQEVLARRDMKERYQQLPRMHTTSYHHPSSRNRR